MRKVKNQTHANLKTFIKGSKFFNFFINLSSIILQNCSGGGRGRGRISNGGGSGGGSTRCVTLGSRRARMACRKSKRQRNRG